MRKIIIFGLLLRLLLLPFSNSHPDVGNHLDWGNRFWQYGPSQFYQSDTWSVSWPNQPFVTIYLFALLSALNTWLQATIWWLNITFPFFPSFLVPLLQSGLHVWLVKLPSIITDLLSAAIIFKLLSRYGRLALVAAAIYLFNPVTIYNSTIWGQTDSLISFFSLLSLFLLFRQRYFSAVLIFLFSLTIKVSLIIYSPLLLAYIRSQRQLLTAAKAALVFFVALIILSSPFHQFTQIFPWLSSHFLHYVVGRQGNMLSGNAFNLWYFVSGADYSVPDTLTFLGLTLKTYGYLLFFGSLLIIIRRLLAIPTFPSLVFALFLTGLSSFLFLTNMHERYLYPPLTLFTLLFAYFPHLFTLTRYYIFSLVHLLNLYHLWFYPSITSLRSLLLWRQSSAGYFFAVFLIIFYLYYLLKYLKGEALPSTRTTNLSS